MSNSKWSDFVSKARPVNPFVKQSNITNSADLERQQKPGMLGKARNFVLGRSEPEP